MSGGGRLRSRRSCALCISMLAILTAGCRDLYFDTLDRLGDSDVLAGRPPARGGRGISGTDRARGFFVSRTGDLAPLQEDIRFHMDLAIRYEGKLRPFAEGTVTLLNFDVLGRDGLPGDQDTVAASYTVAFRNDMPVQDMRRQYRELCQRPELRRFFPDIGPDEAPCDPGHLQEAEDLIVDIDARMDGVATELAWVAPSNRFNGKLEGAPGECVPCEDDPSAVCNRCTEGWQCPGGGVGTCTWPELTCDTTWDCPRTGHCADGTCQPNVVLGNDRGLLVVRFDRDADSSAPVLAATIPLELNVDWQDWFTILVLTPDPLRAEGTFRFQPVACESGSCRTRGGMFFPRYRNDTATGDIRFSDSNLDVHVRGTGEVTEFRVIPGFLCLVLGPGCFALIDSATGAIDVAFRRLFRNTGRLFDNYASAPRVSARIDPGTLAAELLEECRARVASPALCDASRDVIQVVSRHVAVDLGRSRVRLNELPSDPPDTVRIVDVGGVDGQWTDNTVRAFHFGGDVVSVAVDMSAFAFCNDATERADACDTADAGDPPDERCQVCDFCDSFRADLGELGDLCDFGDDERISVEDERDRGQSLYELPASPALSPLVDFLPNFAHEVRRVFTRPIEALEAGGHGGSLGTDAYYTDTLFCPSETRPGDCPPGADGAVFFFIQDYDRDGVPDGEDLCPREADDGSDSDGDGVGDACDDCPCTVSTSTRADLCDCDADGDGCNNRYFVEPTACDWPACEPNGDDGLYDERPLDCERSTSTSSMCADTDRDGFIDDCDRDDDGDGILDDGAGDGIDVYSPCRSRQTTGCDDNCRDTPNPSQLDENDDGTGDACDTLCRGAAAPVCSLPPSEFFNRPSASGAGLLPAGPCPEDEPHCFAWGMFGCAEFLGDCQGGMDYLELLGARGELLLRLAASEVGSQGFGGASTFLSDLDADGRADLALGLPGDGCPPQVPCERPPGAVLAISSSTGQPLLSLSPAGPGAAFGEALVSVGTTIFVGAPGAIDPRGLATGAVLIIDAARQPHLVHTVFGEQEGERFGTSLALVPDEDGDGVPEGLLVGAPLASVRGRQEAGRIDALALDGARVGRFEGLLPGGRMGSQLSAILPNPFTPVSGVLAGMPDALRGSGAIVLFGWNGRPRWFLPGRRGERLGSSLTRAADFDADGFPDVAVGAPGAGQGAGRVLVVSARGRLVELVEGTPGDELGAQVATPGDVDADGFPDLVLTMPGRTSAPDQRPGTWVLLPGAGGALQPIEPVEPR